MHSKLALLCHLAVLMAAYRWSDSTSGFLVTGLGLALLLDRYAWRLLHWPDVSWPKELCIRAGSFVAGVVAFYFLRPGIVPLREAAYRGVIVCLVCFLLGRLASLFGRRRWSRRGRLALMGLAVAALLPLVPPVAALHPLRTVPRRTPAAFGLAFEDVRFRAADGTELAAWLVPHPQPRGNVVFCHGHGRNRGHLAGLLTTLHGLGLNVLAFDFRGHGDSEGYTSTFGHREVQDLQAAVTYLRERFPDQPLLLVGVSLGAAVCLQALPQLSDVRGVWSEGSFARLSDTVDHQFAWLPGLLRVPLVDGYYLLGWLDCGLWGPDANPVDRLQGMAVPVFFCHGKQDELVPLRQGQALYAAHSGPKCCWWVEGATHYNVRQRNEEEYTRRLATFLEACLCPLCPDPPSARGFAP